MARNDDFSERYGPWAVVTGASSGIGEEFAHQLAARGLNLVLVARREERLQELARALEREHEIETRWIKADLSDPDFLESVRAGLAGLEVGLLVNNAGRGFPGEFLNSDVERQLALLDLNLRAPVELTWELAQGMRERRRGGVIFVSSLIGYAPAPYFATYSAAKGFLRQFGNALAYELRDSGVDVLVLSPGGTRTEGTETVFGEKAEKTMPVETVVARGLRDLGRKLNAVPGGQNRMMAPMLSRFVPVGTASRLAAKFTEQFVEEDVLRAGRDPWADETRSREAA